MTVRVATSLLALAAAVAAGCGGPITDDELQRGIESLGATAAEGRLVAQDAAEDRTKVTFVRVQARALAEDTEHEAEKLADAQARIMGDHANGLLARTLGWAYLGLICVLTVAAPVLLFATNGGGG